MPHNLSSCLAPSFCLAPSREELFHQHLPRKPPFAGLQSSDHSNAFLAPKITPSHLHPLCGGLPEASQLLDGPSLFVPTCNHLTTAGPSPQCTGFIVPILQNRKETRTRTHVYTQSATFEVQNKTLRSVLINRLYFKKIRLSMLGTDSE